jgi:hypothetical protein
MTRVTHIERVRRRERNRESNGPSHTFTATMWEVDSGPISL